MLKNTLSALFFTLMLLFGVGAPVQAEEFENGKDYFTISSPVPVRDKSKIEVVEKFWYGCPHCNSFDPYIKSWRTRQADYVDFWHSPAVFSEVWKTHAQAFYAAEALGVGEEMHQPLFDALARDKKPLNSEKALAEFFSGFGIDEDRFSKAYNSFGVKSKVEQARNRSMDYGLSGVPAIVVNGKYRVEPGGAKSFPRFLEIVDYLVELERKTL